MMLDEVEREAVRKAARDIFRVFAWVESKKGGEYWNDVYEELMRIAETGEP